MAAATHNGWARIALPLGVIAVAGLVAWGIISEKVEALRENAKMLTPKVLRNSEDVAVLRSRWVEINKKLDRILEQIAKEK
jgi:hypothetical protein